MRTYGPGLVNAQRTYHQWCGRDVRTYVPHNLVLGRCLQHCGGEPERAKGADGMQLFALDCIAYIVDAETN